MSDVPITRLQVLRALTKLVECRDCSEDLTIKLRQALLDFALETPDNLN